MPEDKTIKCVVVDDEPMARELLEKYIADVPVLELVRTCKNAIEAAEALRALKVDLIFLDINMPRLSGMQFYRSLANPPAVIFTTAYPEYALEGFEVDATDYLLKPFSFERFFQAVNRILDKEKAKGRKNESRSYLLLKSDKKIHRVLPEDIVYLESLGDYVKVHFPDHYLLVHDTLKNLVSDLKEGFSRIHKSFAIALDKVHYIEGNQVIVGDPPKEIPIGMAYKDAFLKMLNGNV
jgi:DNA-binding LytR/AlgR family response regulator